MDAESETNGTYKESYDTLLVNKTEISKGVSRRDGVTQKSMQELSMD